MQVPSKRILCLLLLSACEATRSDDVFTSVGPIDQGTTTNTSLGGVEGGDPGTGDADDGIKLDVGDGGEEGDTGDSSACPCRGVDDGIYLLSRNEELWFYNPLENAFTQLGDFGCPAQGQINSMAVDRQGRAWLNYVNLDFTNPLNPVVGSIYRATIDDPSDCSDPGYSPPTGTFLQFGMGFAANSASDACDQLYLFDGRSAMGSVARIDPATLELTTLGQTSYPQAELTGTGDGRLFAFAAAASPGGNATLVQLDKATAEPIEELPLTGLSTSDSYAFAFWGGDVYFFTNAGGGVSQVTRLDYDGNAGGGLDVVEPNAPALFVGAGVSTCASFTPVG